MSHVFCSLLYIVDFIAYVQKSTNKSLLNNFSLQSVPRTRNDGHSFGDQALVIRVVNVRSVIVFLEHSYHLPVREQSGFTLSLVVGGTAPPRFIFALLVVKILVLVEYQFGVFVAAGHLNLA